MLKQVLFGPSTAMSATSGNAWYFDSGCCNHMTSDSTIFLSRDSILYKSPIKTADGSQLHVKHIGQVSTPNLSLTITFRIPKLTINLIYVGQLCDLGLNIVFSSFGGHVHDSQTMQIIVIGRKVGRLFEFVHIYTPPKNHHSCHFHYSCALYLFLWALAFSIRSCVCW